MPYTFNRTRTQLANLVLTKVGLLASGGTPASADSDVLYEAIDLRLKEIHRLGVFWRKVPQVPLSFSLVSGTNSASATGDILFPISMTVSDGSLDETVDIIGAKEYGALENKGQGGFPTKALWKGSAEFLFHPVPQAAATAKLVYEKYIDDTSAGGTMDVDVAMLRHLANIVAYDVGDYFGIDEPKLLRWAKDAQKAELDIRKLSVEHKSYATVSVDDWGTRVDRTVSDYGM